MKIKCQWVFLEDRKMLAKEKLNVEKMSCEELNNMIINLLAQNETVRIIFEKVKE